MAISAVAPRAHKSRRVRHGGGEQGDEPVVGIADARCCDSGDGAGHDVTALAYGHARATRTDLLHEPAGPGIGPGAGAEGGLRVFAQLLGKLIVAFSHHAEGDTHPDRQ